MDELWIPAAREKNEYDDAFNVVYCKKNQYTLVGHSFCRIRDDWSICIITHGKVDLLNTGEYVEKNQMYIFPPNSTQDLCYPTLSSSYWIHLKGSEVDAIMRTLQIPFCKSFKIADKHATAILDEILSESLMKQKHYKEMSTLLAKKFLYNIPREIDTKNLTIAERLKNAVSQLYLDPTLSNEQCAALCFITPATFIRLFKSYYHTTPHKFKQQLIISRAKELLTETSYSINNIALRLGFQNNPLYFSNYFKSCTGMYPSDYRQKYALPPQKG